MTPVMSPWEEMVPIRDHDWRRLLNRDIWAPSQVFVLSLLRSHWVRGLEGDHHQGQAHTVYVSGYDCWYFHTQKYWSCPCHKRRVQIALSLLRVADNGCLAGKIYHILKLLCHLRSKTSSAGSPLISLSGPETTRALSQNLSGPGKHNASSITGASSTGFSFYCGGPLQRPDPLSFHIHVPTPVIWLTSAENTLSFWAFSHSLLHVPFIFIPQFLPLRPPVAPSLFSLLMRSELVLKIMMWSSRSEQQMKRRFRRSPETKPTERMWRAFQNKAAAVCVPSKVSLLVIPHKHQFC